MNWHVMPKISDEFRNQLSIYSLFTAQLLYNRGMKTSVEAEAFLKPDFLTGVHNPLLMTGMEEAIKIIKKSAQKKEKIFIYGDYDVDGVCSVLILKTVFDAIGVDGVESYIPDRAKEGYGLNSRALRELKKAGAKLIITVDCGISNFAEVKLAKKLAMKVIVTDHHQVVEGKVPEAAAVINSHQPADKYPFKELAGAGVAYKLATALINEFKLVDGALKIDEGLEKWLLDLVALATVADLAIMLDENRVLVKYGLIVLNKTRRVGIKELINQASLSAKKIDTYEISFLLSPRLNSASRMDHANMAYALLATNSSEEAKWLAQRLNQLNQERQSLVERLMKSIEAKINLDGKIIFEGGENWPNGVLSLVASKLCDRYSRPAFVFNQEGGEARGSSRSVPAFNLVDALSQCAPLLNRFGGHPGAAGFSLSSKNLVAFKERLLEIAASLTPDVLVPTLEIEAELSPDDIGWQSYEEVQSLAPFGRGNQRPIFSLSNLQIKNIKAVGNGGKHSKLELRPVGYSKIFKAIAFNFTSVLDKLNADDMIDIAFELIANEWNGSKDLELKIVDLKVHQIV